MTRWGPSTSGWSLALLLITLGLLGLTAVRWPARRRAALTGLAVVVVAAGVGAVAVTRASAVRGGPVADLARERALVTLTGTVTADPRRIPGRFGERVLVRVAVGRHQPVLVFGEDDWGRLAIRERVRFTGRLAPVDDGDVAATVTPRGPPVRIAAPGPGWRATRRCAPRSATQSTTGPRARQRWCRPWSTATTRGCRRS